jgi:hypothetical protein
LGAEESLCNKDTPKRIWELNRFRKKYTLAIPKTKNQNLVMQEENQDDFKRELGLFDGTMLVKVL